MTFHYQPTGSWSTSSVPFFKGGTNHLRYGDMLYLNEAHIQHEMARYKYSAWNLLPYDDGLIPIKAEASSAGAASPASILRSIRGSYISAQNDFTDGNNWVKRGVSIPSFIVPASEDGNYFGFDNVRSALNIDQLTSQEDFSPVAVGDRVDAEPFKRAFNLLRKTSRTLKQGISGTVSINGTRIVRTSRRSSPDGAWSTTTDQYSIAGYSLGSFYAQYEQFYSQQDGYVSRKTEADISCSISFAHENYYTTMSVSRIIMRVIGRYQNQRGSFDNFKSMYFSQAVNVSGASPSFNLNLSSEQAASYADELGMDTSKGWAIHLSPILFDLSYSFEWD